MINSNNKPVLRILDTIKYFLVIKYMSDQDPDNDGVAVLKQQNKMSIHDVECEVEGPHLVEDWVANIKDDRIHSGIEEYRPKVIPYLSYVHQKVDQAQQ